MRIEDAYVNAGHLSFRALSQAAGRERLAG
jgi:hypothetical protein